MRRPALVLLPVPLVLAGAVVLGQQTAGYTDPGQARTALAEARRQEEAARARAEQLEQQAHAAVEAADRSAHEAAALAARIQQAEAGVAAQRATMALIDRQREDLRIRLAERQQPLVRLTAALQRLARRPLLFTLFRPGSVQDTMHLRAVLATMLPEVASRTAGLRGDIDRARALRVDAERAVDGLRQEQQALAARRTDLSALETSQRLVARQSAGTADREAERALALSEQARDLGSLADTLAKAGTLRDALAALPGPVMRPDRPEAAQAFPGESVGTMAAPRAPAAFLLPVQGRIVAGFGESATAALRSRGITLAPQPGAQVVAPGAGRVAFAGPYRGFGQIVIVDHGQGWTSLVTGLSMLDLAVGQQVVAGSPLGTAPGGRPTITYELRRDGQPVNPLEFSRVM